MSANRATNSGISSLVPAEIQALFGDPPLMRGEDAALYYKFMDEFTKLVEPKDIIEWWWVKDITDHRWEIRCVKAGAIIPH